LNFSQVRLIFTDFEMPGINGPKMSAKIRSYEKEKKISEGDKRRVVIIGLTGHDSLAV